MMHTVENDWKTRKKVEAVVSFPKGEPEMTEADVAFLCGLIRMAKPKKLLELGVAAGGSTVMILQCLDDMMQEEPAYKPQVISGDRMETYYRNKKKKAGYLIESFKEHGNHVEHRLVAGKVYPDYRGLVGDVDFVLLDTAHVLPGEILDFLAVLPALNKDAIVCFHDISLNLARYHNFKCVATNVLFDAACGEKYLNPVSRGEGLEADYPNIAAIRITDDTWKYIENVFCLFMLTWNYLPSDKECRKYEELYKQYYHEDCIKIFRQAQRSNYGLFHSKKMNFKERLIRMLKVLGTGRV